MGSLKKIGDGKYRLYVSNGFRADGKPNRMSKVVKASSDRAAKKLLNELELSFCKKPPQINCKLSFREFSNVWKERHERFLSPNTQNGDLGILKNRLLPYFAQMQLSKISVTHVEGFVDELNTKKQRLDNREGTISLGTIYHIYKLLRSMLNKAVEWGYISSNPCNELSKDKRPKKKFAVPDIMQYDQLEDFLQKLFGLKDTATNTKHKLFLYLSLMDGGRLGEHVAITWDDVDLEHRKLTISKGTYEENRITKVKSTKTENIRTVYFDDIVAELFKKHKAYQEKWLKKNKLENPNKYVFLKTRLRSAEMPTRAMFGHWLTSFLKKNNLFHIGVHGFRRMAASYALDNGVPLTAVKAMLGHTDISTTNKYLRYLNKTRVQSAEAMSNVYQSMIKRDS